MGVYSVRGFLVLFVVLLAFVGDLVLGEWWRWRRRWWNWWCQYWRKSPLKIYPSINPSMHF
ncbi:hypothetical protein HanHA89_Chr01g0029581 [Helianthus annuus]|nr:hypothetical protein HanHA89_Chr01g0029581 [Helianthus annuus]